MDIMSLLMAKRAGGNTPSGGGSVNSVNGVKPDGAGNVALKYDDLEGKYFGEETKETKLVPDTTYTDNGGITFLDGSYPLEEGVSYLVEWDGKRYDCVGTPAIVYGYDLITVGNPALVGAGDDNGMPFAIGCVIADGSYAVTAAATGDHTFSILGEVTELKRIDPKFLPEGVPYEVRGEMVKVLPETSPTYDAENGKFMMMGAVGLVDGKTYIVNWNGTKYTCVATDASALMGAPAGSAVIMGNAGALDPAFPVTEDPFIFVAAAAEGAWLVMPLDGTTELTISIVQDETTIKKLDNKFLDLAWLPTAEEGWSVFIPERTTVPTGSEMSEIDWQPATDAQKVKVTINGVDYESGIKMVEGAAYYGNAGLLGTGLANTGEPFCIIPSANRFMVEDTITVETLSVSIATLSYNKIPSGFMEEGLICCKDAPFKWSNAASSAVSVAHGKGRTLVTCAGSYFIYSDDFAEWKRVDCEFTPVSVAYGNGVFVAVCSVGSIWSSKNGVDWVCTKKQDDFGRGKIVVFHTREGQFSVLQTNKHIVNSADGFQWDGAYYGTTKGDPVGAISANGYLVALRRPADDGGNVSLEYTTHCGGSRTFVEIDSRTITKYANPIAYGNGVYIAVINSTRVFRSADLKTWERVEIPFSDATNVVFAFGKFVMGNGYHSTDGVTWSGPYDNRGAMIYAHGKLLSLKSDGTAMVSSDGDNWRSEVKALFDTDGNNVNSKVREALFTTPSTEPIVDSIFMHSANGKTYRIIVDDNGTLSVKEVTE